MSNYKYYVAFKKGKFCVGSFSDNVAMIEYQVEDNWINYRAHNKITINDLKIDVHGWKFNSEILLDESSNFHDVERLRFSIKGINPNGKPVCVDFVGQYIYHPEDEHNSAVFSVLTALYLIATSTLPNDAKEIYESVLTYPYLSPYPKTYLKTYSRALSRLIECKNCVSRIKTNDTYSKDFKSAIISSFNQMIFDYSDNIIKYRGEAKLD